MSASFEQVLLDSNGRVLAESSGTMAIKRPGRFRWHYTAPEELLVLGDGRWAITCDRREQVVELEYDDLQWRAGGAAALLLGTIRSSLASLLNPPGISASLEARAVPGDSRGSD